MGTGESLVYLGVTHWAARLMADRLGIAFASVAWIWRKYGPPAASCGDCQVPGREARL
ncbi:hypothetical protein ABFA25_04235 [Mycobacterium lepromatosis]|uniref:hypothetical protein n=1 Tax=Mycobacterium lepromatosis TaxID=480418 RepID=UPI003D805C0E